VLTKAQYVSDAAFCCVLAYQFSQESFSSGLSFTMFTPAITGYGPQMTASPYTLPSLSTVAQTTLIQELRRGNPPAILTNAQTCGYTSGAWSSAVTCGPQQSCTYYTTPYSAPNFGCCSEGVGCGYVSTCLDYKAMGNSNRGAGVLISDQQFLWYVLCVPSDTMCGC
jgi:hypothetical protein